MPMFNDPVTSMQRPNLRRQDYFGFVIANDDSTHPDGRKIQRVKVRIPQKHRNIPDEDIPWSLPDANQSVNNGGGGTGAVNVPPVGTKVFVRMEDNDPHNPRYSGSPTTSDVTEENELLQDDYPHTRGFVDHAGNRWDINAEKNTVNFTHKSGATMYIDANGSISASAAHDLNISGQGDINVAAKGKINMNGAGGVFVDGQQIHLNSGGTPGAGNSTSRSRPSIPSSAGKVTY